MLSRSVSPYGSKVVEAQNKATASLQKFEQHRMVQCNPSNVSGGNAAASGSAQNLMQFNKEGPPYKERVKYN